MVTLIVENDQDDDNVQAQEIHDIISTINTAGMRAGDNKQQKHPCEIVAGHV